MALAAGARLGVYEVLAPLGQGGMGEVYRARDTKLNRDVALKILPEAFATEPERLARFQREAQVLASLSHPNIGGIYGLEESGDTKSLVLELVEGPTLADRIAQRAIPVDEALSIARQIAEALEAAHEAGVIHRDLKPANIKLRPDGTVKVLDFGLAKTLDPPGRSPDVSQSPTMTSAHTMHGAIVGTAAYMSPEQALGKPADKRTDIWAFGCVLYEMLTRRRAFGGATVSETLAHVLTQDLDWSLLPGDAPEAVRYLLRRCLERDLRRRLRDIGEARIAIEASDAVPAGLATGTARPPRRRGWLPAAILALAVAAVAGAAVWTVTRPTPDSSPIRLALVPPAGAPLNVGGLRQNVVISPDGTRVVYNGPAPGGGSQLNLRSIDRLDSAALDGEGGTAPFFSPDGEWLGFLDAGGTTLRKVSTRGGPAVTVTESPRIVFGASWDADDTIVFGTASAGLFRIPGSGGEPERLTTLATGRGETGHRWPFHIQGREAVLFVIATGPALTTGQLAVLDLDTREVTRLGLAGVSPRYVATGHVVYAAPSGSLLAVPFDAASLDVAGDPVPLIESVVVSDAGAADFSVSATGRLVYVPAAERESAPRALVWVDRDGGEEPLAVPAGQYLYPRFAPDGTRVAVVVSENADDLGAPSDLWVLDLMRGSRSRITFAGNNRFFPVWSPDGAHLVFADGAGTPNRLLLARADGSAPIETLLDRGERQFPTSWASSGNVLALYVHHSRTERDLAVLRMSGDLTPVPFLATPFRERAAVFSPDGGWLAYVSDKSGQDEIYVRAYPDRGQEYTISTSGGREPVWSRNGRELFYRNAERVMAVAIDTAGSFSAAPPTLLFAGPYDLDNSGGGGVVANYDVAPDGQRFLMIKSPAEQGEPGPAPQITVVLNWIDELRRLVPTE